MSKFKFQVDKHSHQLKYLQLVDAINEAISENLLQKGDLLPSVNQLCKESLLSRDTVFKAYSELKTRGVVESVPNRGYFITHAVSKIFLFLDTFKAYKEVLYGALLDNLPDNYVIDLHFHHYDIELFEKTIKESIGKYSKYVIMNFDHQRMATIIDLIPKEKLLVIDWAIHCPAGVSAVFQNFGEALFQVLEQNSSRTTKYKRFIYLYPEFTYHPKESITYFEKFCQKYHPNYQLLRSVKQLDVKKGDLYLLVSDRTLAMFLDQCDQKKLIPGVDAGVISYNETPMKKYVKNGISVISTDFKKMAQAAAEFIVKGSPIHLQIPTSLKIRASF